MLKWENSQFVSLCYFIFLQISFINTKSQLFTLKNNKIVMFNQIEILDEVFYIITSRRTKDGDSHEFMLDSL